MSLGTGVRFPPPPRRSPGTRSPATRRTTSADTHRGPTVENDTSLFEWLVEVAERPEPFATNTVAALWADDHVATQMLGYHLDPDVDLASRRHEFIDRSTSWIVDEFGIGPSSRVLDLGCGPGLYTNRLAARGARVTGVDLSASSLSHARSVADRDSLDVAYVLGDYTHRVPDGPFDLVTMIMCDFSVLDPASRATLLRRVRGRLAPGGAFLFDVHSLEWFAGRTEGTRWGLDLMGRFWSPDPHVVLAMTAKYGDAAVTLDRYAIVEATRRWVVDNWLQHYDVETITSEVEGAGLSVDSVVGSVAGDPLPDTATELTIVSRRR